MNRIMLMFTEDGFYPIEALITVPLEQQAKDHGEINDHIIIIEDLVGNVLWERLKQ